MAETTVTAAPDDDGATSVVKLGGVAEVDGTVPLSVGGSVEVTAEDGNITKTYNVTMTKAKAETETAPDKLTGEVIGKGQVRLDWNNVAEASSYEVRFWALTDWVDLPTDDIGIVFDGSNATVSGLPNYGFYYFDVRAVNAVGPSDWSHFLTLIP